MSILLAGQVDKDKNLPEHKNVNMRNRSVLWKVKTEVIYIFIEAESTFKSMVFKCLHHIDSKEIVSWLQKNSSVLANFSKIKSQTGQAVKMEVALNLLEDLLSLYARTRTFLCER